MQAQVGRADKEPIRVSAAGLSPRPLAVGVIKDRLGPVSDDARRAGIALHLAETCHECFQVEGLIRELIDRDPGDLDGVLTVLADLEVQLRHTSEHWERLREALAHAMRAVDRAPRRASARISPDMKAATGGNRRWRQEARGLA